MTFDRRDSNKPFHLFLRDAEVAFLKEVAQSAKSSYLDFKVYPGGTQPMLTFEGADRSDISVKGLVAIFVLDDNDVKVYMEMDHAMLGHKNSEMRLKTGEMTPELVAKRLNDFVLGA